MSKINFTINFETRLKRKFQKFLELYQIEIGCEFLKLKIERCLKIEGQFQANFFVKTDFINKEQIVYEVLRLTNLLLDSGFGRSTFIGPFLNDGQLQFECIINNENDDQPLKWAQIQIDEIVSPNVST